MISLFILSDKCPVLQQLFLLHWQLFDPLLFMSILGDWRLPTQILHQLLRWKIQSLLSPTLTLALIFRLLKKGKPLSHPGWRAAMEEEMMALDANGTWELVPLPADKRAIGCKWVFTVKMNPDAKLASIRLFISLAATSHWVLHQLDIKNAFLHGDLQEEVYIEQPPGFVAQRELGRVCRLRKSLYGLKQSPRAWFGRFSEVVQEFGMKKSKCDHSVFYRHSETGLILLVVYVDDIVITGNDTAGISSLKFFLQTQFQTKDLGVLNYFLGIEVTRCKRGIFLSQRKYVLDLLVEIEKLGAKPCSAPMAPNLQLTVNDDELFEDPKGLLWNGNWFMQEKCCKILSLIVSVRPKVHDVMGPNGGSSDSMSKLTNIDDVLNSLVKWLCFQGLLQKWSLVEKEACLGVKLALVQGVEE
uniref:Reverse transcriptase Ty1/copia-type domain-containing protein n=1 Tax=Ananas comosus var. bracteatus TaxID=296719 RepID=A0A6V7NSU7_ANACO|nr:unnamed protein product [Ananas comosus var. bracteatus]